MRSIAEARFHMWCWQCSRTGSFSNQLLDLFAKADFKNFGRLTCAFPEYGITYNEWFMSSKPDELLETWRKEWQGSTAEAMQPTKGEK